MHHDTPTGVHHRQMRALTHDSDSELRLRNLDIEHDK
jgi:hypothetical protein